MPWPPSLDNKRLHYCRHSRFYGQQRFSDARVWITTPLRTRVPCLICKELFDKEKHLLVTVARGTCDQRRYHLECAFQGGLVLGSIGFTGNNKKITKDLKNKFKSTEIAEPTRKRTRDEEHPRRKKRKIENDFSSKFKKVCLAQDVSMIKKLKKCEIAALLLWNGVEVFDLMHEKICLKRSAQIYSKQFEYIAEHGRPKACKRCDGKPDIMFEDNRTDDPPVMKCAGNWEGQLYNECNKSFPKRWTAGSLTWPTKEDLNNSGGAIKTFLREYFSKTATLAGFEVQFSEDLLQELLSFIPEEPQFFKEIATGQFSTNCSADFV